MKSGVSPADLVPWFQMASTIIAGLGIVVSVSLGIASLNNNRRDRLAKIQPDLLFNIGGQKMSVTLHSITFMPGLTQDDPEVVEFLTTLPKDRKGPALNGYYGQLYNHGAGPALSVYIWFEPDRVTIGGGERRLTRAEQYSAPYTKDWNCIAAMPNNLSEGDAAFFGILPVSVYAAGPDVSAMSGAMQNNLSEGDAAFFGTLPVSVYAAVKT